MPVDTERWHAEIGIFYNIRKRSLSCSWRSMLAKTLLCFMFLQILSLIFILALLVYSSVDLKLYFVLEIFRLTQ